MNKMVYILEEICYDENDQFMLGIFDSHTQAELAKQELEKRNKNKNTSYIITLYELISDFNNFLEKY